MEPDYSKIFNLKEDLPAPEQESELALVQQLDQLALKIKQIQSMGYKMSEEEMIPIYSLMDEVEDVPMAAAVLGFIFLMLSEYKAMATVFEKAIENHGEIPAFIFYSALALKKLGMKENSLEHLQRLIGAGAKHYLVFMMAAEIQYELGQHRACISMCNLAVYENQEEKTEPFILMATCFKDLNETERMFECFNRIEKLRGPMALQRELGSIYSEYGEMYEKVKGMMGGQGA